MTVSTVTPIVLTAANEATLNSDIAKVDGAKSGAYEIEITSSFALDDAITAIDLARSGVTLTITGAAAPGGVATIDAGGLYPGLSILSNNVTIAGSVDVTDTHLPTPAFAPSSFNDLAVGAAVTLQDFAYNFDDKISVVALAGAPNFEVDVTLPDTVIATELFNGTQTGSYKIPVAMGLEDGAGDSIRVVDLSAAPLSLAQYENLGNAAKNSGAYILSLNAHTFAADLATFNGDASLVGVDLVAGLGTLTGGLGIVENYVAIAGGALIVDETLSYSGDMSVVSGSLGIAQGEEAIFSGVLNVHGTLDGKGVLLTDGGSTTVVAATGEVTVARWAETGQGTKVLFEGVNQHQSYLGVFALGAGATLTVSRDNSLELAQVANVANAGGTLQIADDAFLTIDGAVAAGETIDFIKSSSTLDLGAAQNFHGQIENFASAADVVLSGDWNMTSVTSVTSGSTTDTVLLLKNVAAGETAKLTFDGSFSADQFKISNSVTGITASTSISFA